MHCKLTMIAHNLLGTKRDITATAAAAAASSEVDAATDADADRDTTAATTNSCRNKFSRREQARCVCRPSLLALAVPQFMLLKLSHGQLYSEPQIIARNGKEDGHDDDKSQHTAH